MNSPIVLILRRIESELSCSRGAVVRVNSGACSVFRVRSCVSPNEPVKRTTLLYVSFIVNRSSRSMGSSVSSVVKLGGIRPLDVEGLHI